MTSDSNPGPTSGTSSPGVGNGPDEISLWEVLAVLIRRRGTVVLMVVLTVGLSVAATLLRDDEFTTATSFRPQGSEASGSQLLQLASQFGVNVPMGGSDDLSPAFYQEFLTSREILHRVATKRYDVVGEQATSLVDLFEVEEDTEELRLEVMIELLRESVVTVQLGRESGVVTVQVVTRWPDLSQAIAEQLLDEIARFNLGTRQSQAAGERRFIAERVDSAQDALEAAEERMRAFLRANRQWQDSPDLTFQRDRLQRDITSRQTLYTALVQSLDQARISEVRDTPVITVLQPPFLPPGPDDSPLLLAIALGIVLGGLAGVVLAFVLEALRRPADGDPAREEFQRSVDGLLRSIPFVGGRA